jgi:hypothetical protein
VQVGQYAGRGEGGDHFPRCARRRHRDRDDPAVRSDGPNDFPVLQARPIEGEDRARKLQVLDDLQVGRFVHLGNDAIAAGKSSALEGGTERLQAPLQISFRIRNDRPVVLFLKQRRDPVGVEGRVPALDPLVEKIAAGERPTEDRMIGAMERDELSVRRELKVDLEEATTSRVVGPPSFEGVRVGGLPDSAESVRDPAREVRPAGRPAARDHPDQEDEGDQPRGGANRSTPSATRDDVRGSWTADGDERDFGAGRVRR